jgi:hypothetical protein
MPHSGRARRDPAPATLRQGAVELTAGEEAPAFALLDQSATPVKLADFKG